MGCSPWGHKELDTTEWVNNSKSNYNTLQQKLGKLSTCVQLHLNENCRKQNWKSQISTSSYPRILTFGPTQTFWKIPFSILPMHELPLPLPRYLMKQESWVCWPPNWLHEGIALIQFQIAVHENGNVCTEDFFSFFNLWGLIVEMIFGVEDAIVGFGLPLGRRATINHALRNVNLEQTAELRRWIRQCSFWQKLLCWFSFQPSFLDN